VQSVDTSLPTASETSARREWPGVVVFAATGALFARLLVFVSHYAVNIFFMDQWDINEATLFQKHSLWEMFRWQQGPHRQGLGAIVTYLVEPFFRWNSRTDSFLVAGILLLATVCALWLKKRLFGRLDLFDVCIPMILLSPLQYETVFITANLAHGPLPLLLVLFYCLAWTVPHRTLRYSLLLLINFAAIHTGFGFFLGVITPAALAADYWRTVGDRPRGALLFSISFSLLSLALFFVHYTFETSVDCTPNVLQEPAAFLRFFCLMLANLFAAKGTGFFPFLVGAVLLIFMLAGFLVSTRSLRVPEPSRRGAFWTAAILLTFCLMFCANAAYGRSCLGPQVAQVSRYVIYMGLGLLGLYFFVTALSSTALRRTLSVVLLVALVTTLPIRKEDESVMRFVSLAKRNWKACYLQIEDIRTCNHAVGYGVYPNLGRGFREKLQFLKHTRQNLYADLP